MKTNQTIIKVKKNQDGGISDVMLQNGYVIPINQAVLMAKDGLIEDCYVRRGKDGGEFLVHDTGEANENINLSDYPTFK